MLLALTHGFAKSALFQIAELGGTARTLPVTTFTLVLAAAALIGLAPSGTFLAKWQLL